MRALTMSLFALTVAALVAPYGVVLMEATATDSDTFVGKWESESEVEGGYFTVWFNSDGTGRATWEGTAGGYEEGDFEWMITTGMYYQKNSGDIDYEAYDYYVYDEDRIYTGFHGILIRAESDDSLLGGLGCCSCCGAFIGVPATALVGLSTIIRKRR